ncbi:hypothetical protein EDB86DRAFT_2835649 [Lactarius hatsudake]|nr:hypothetical protein EDB86DRAFT_2835649 [Lactarius hatsudake]
MCVVGRYEGKGVASKTTSEYQNGQKSRQQHTHVRTLELAQRKKVENQADGNIEESVSHLEDNSPFPEADREASTPVIVGLDDEDGPYQFVKTEGSDTDQDNLVDDPMQTNIECFASTLREAQCLAVQIKKDEEKQKSVRGRKPGHERCTPKVTIWMFARLTGTAALHPPGHQHELSFLYLEQLEGGRTGGRMALVEEEEEDSPRSEPELGANAHEFDWRSKGSAPFKVSGSSVTGGPDDEDSEDLSMSEEFHAPSVGLSAHESSKFKGGSGDKTWRHLILKTPLMAMGMASEVAIVMVMAVKMTWQNPPVRE